jgi:hypothetical protein
LFAQLGNSLVHQVPGPNFLLNVFNVPQKSNESLECLLTAKMSQFKNEYPLTYVRLDDPPVTQTGKARPLSTAEQKAVLQSQSFFWGSSWTLEILSCLTSVVFLVAIIVVLYEYDGKPMPDWPYGITLNALVSVLSTAMKASMVFIVCEGLSQLKWSWFSSGNKLSDLALLDAASRGPAGAIIALLRFVPR